jgi:hypothetical protein
MSLHENDRLLNPNPELENLYKNGKQKDFMKEKEILDVKDIKNIGDKYDFLYPSLDDPNFNTKIAKRKEFNDTRYDGKIKDVMKEAERICNADFELAPHQAFVRNFLSFQTPYNSLLLYHGLGSGKTCSAISVAEEMRDYMKQMNINQRIIIVAAPNIQENFRLQLFDERKLKKVDGYWNIRSCVGNKLLREVNPMNVQDISKEKIVSYINRVINNYYLFLGYIEFSNYIEKKSEISKDDPDFNDEQKMRIKQARKLRKVFDNRLIIIDEVHDIRVSEDSKKKRVATQLMKLVRSVDNLRLLLLSATPMYNNYKEIIWLINLMNVNDNRAPIEIKDVFDDKGDFKTDSRGIEVGRELLERKATGYISFVRGENPYMFPFKLWPKYFAPDKCISAIEYPKVQLNGREIVQTIEKLQLYINDIGSYQQKGYGFIIDQLRDNVKMGIGAIREMPNFDNMESFGYTMLQRPLEALNIVYPYDKLEEYLEYGILNNDLDRSKNETTSIENINPRQLDVSYLVGKNGLNRLMSYKERKNPPFRGNYEYKTDKYGRIFSPSEIGKYSGKIKSICDSIINSEGIVIVFSQYIDGGIVPMALALEELGFIRHGKVPSLFNKPPTKPINSQTFEPIVNKKSEKTASYVMITGDKTISPNNLEDFLAATNSDNKDGSVVKVVLLSQAGGQGLDFTNIRQVHILEPWYNMNRAEQVIGRGVRSCSHKALSFDKHNVQIYLHGTKLNSNIESADLYVYRLAETKAVQIGRISRILKEISVDCILNIEQQNFTEINMKQTVKQRLSKSNNEVKEIDYPVGDKPFSFTCDYMETCEYKCRPNMEAITDDNISDDTYNESFIQMNNERILQRVRELFKEKHLFDKVELIKSINILREYPIEQINSALHQLVNDGNELITDQYGRIGKVVNVDKLYLFQPNELSNPKQSLFNRRVPLQFKRTSLKLPQLNRIEKSVEEKEKELLEKSNNIIKLLQQKYNVVFDDINTNKSLEIDNNDWYNLCNKVVKQMIEENENESQIRKIVLSHIVEELLFDDLIILLNRIYGKQTLTKFEDNVKQHIENILIRNNNTEGLFWIRNNKRVLIVKTDKNEWKIAESEDERDLAIKIKGLFIPENKYNNIVGYISDFKNLEMVFKVKQLDKKRNKGARCDQSGKKTAIELLNEIIGEEKYDKENTKNMAQKELCVIQELILRMYQEENKNNKIWFVTPGVAALNKL